MTAQALQIVSFCLVPVGAFLFIKGFKLLRTFVATNILLDMPFAQAHATFLIPESGDYAIWQSGKKVNKVPLDMPPISIQKVPGGEAVRIARSFGNMHVSSGTSGRIQVYHFWAAAGQYQLAFTEAFANQTPQKTLGIFTRKPLDLSAHHLQIREKRPGWMIVAGVLLLLLAFACVVGGLVTGANADELIKQF